MDDEKRTQPSPKQGLSGADFAGLGLQFAFAIVAFLFLGQWIDKRAGTDGVFTILGVFVGAGGAFYSMYRKVIAAQKKDDEERKAMR
ncbi:MAG TPA: AtpZ/AtpI family protein [Gemmatimonadaceae bacterium]|jgi:F0F1-type ATP synthase assembly protein I